MGACAGMGQMFGTHATREAVESPMHWYFTTVVAAWLAHVFTASSMSKQRNVGAAAGIARQRIGPASLQSLSFKHGCRLHVPASVRVPGFGASAASTAGAASLGPPSRGAAWVPAWGGDAASRTAASGRGSKPFGPHVCLV